MEVHLTFGSSPQLLAVLPAHGYRNSRLPGGSAEAAVWATTLALNYFSLSSHHPPGRSACTFRAKCAKNLFYPRRFGVGFVAQGDVSGHAEPSEDADGIQHRYALSWVGPVAGLWTLSWVGPELGGSCSWSVGLERGQEAGAPWCVAGGVSSTEHPPRHCDKKCTSQNSATARSHLGKERGERADCMYLLKGASVPACLGGNKVATTAEEMETPFLLNTLFYYLHFFTMFMYDIFQIFTLKYLKCKFKSSLL